MYRSGSVVLSVFFCSALVATLFGTIFLRDPPRSRGDLSSRVRVNQQALDRKKASFVYHFLVNDQSDFILGR
jgi:phosphatidylinositol-bisphosphatase